MKAQYNQLKVTLPRLGIKTKFTKDDKPESFEEQIDENTKWFYLEVHRNFKISNYWQINSVMYNP